MLEQLFTHTAWDDVEAMLYNYYNCKLNRDIGQYKKGDIIKLIAINFNSGQMFFFVDKGEQPDEVTEFKLTIEAQQHVEAHSSS